MSSFSRKLSEENSERKCLAKMKMNARLKQGDMFLAGQESRDCFDLFLTSGFEVFGIHLSLALGTANSNN